MYGIIIVSRGKGNKIKNKIKNLLTNKLSSSIIKEKREVLKMSYTVRFIIVAVALSVVVGGFLALCIVNTIAENGSDEYYYTCDNCGHTIVIHGLRER